jgi:hypothetical protein
VDPFFTDAFVQQPATPAYVQLLQQLPRAFVGSAAELKKVVALITSQSILAYASNVSLYINAYHLSCQTSAHNAAALVLQATTLNAQPDVCY